VYNYITSILKEKHKEESLFTDFPSFYSQHLSLVKSLVYNLCGNFHTEDIIQEIFLQLWKNRKKFKGDSHIKTWVYRVSYNKTIDYIRKHKEIYEEYNFEDSIEDNHDIKDLIQKSLLKMDVEKRILIILSAFEGETIEEISKSLKIKKGTVKSRLHYAKKELKEILKKEGVKYE